MNTGTQEGKTRMAAGIIRRTLIATLLAVAIGSVWTQAAPAQVPAPPGGPVLVVTDPADQFGQYYGEILRAEGLNEFAIANVGNLNAQTLAAYQVVVLAETDLTGAQVSALTAWVNGGGNLIAMRPDASLAGLLGLGSDVGDLANGYLQVQPGRGITGRRCSTTTPPTSGRAVGARRSRRRCSRTRARRRGGPRSRCARSAPARPPRSPTTSRGPSSTRARATRPGPARSGTGPPRSGPTTCSSARASRPGST